MSIKNLYERSKKSTQTHVNAGGEDDITLKYLRFVGERLEDLSHVVKAAKNAKSFAVDPIQSGSNQNPSNKPAEKQQPQGQLQQQQGQGQRGSNSNNKNGDFSDRSQQQKSALSNTGSNNRDISRSSSSTPTSTSSMKQKPFSSIGNK